MAESSDITVFLALCSKAQVQVRKELALVLEMAGMNVLPVGEKYPEETNLQTMQQDIAKANCSVHIVYPQYGPPADAITGNSDAKEQIRMARDIQKNRPGFKIFIWLPPSTSASSIESKQQEFIDELQNSVVQDMVFSNAGSGIQLAEDIRSLMKVKVQQEFNVGSTDVFIIANQLDEVEAKDIIDMLSDIIPVEKLNIVQDSDVDYSELCKQQIPQSKLAVIYFKNSGDWAIPFVQQVWKKIGGATSHTPILLIGDSEPQENAGKKFNAPKVISLLVQGDLIPLEIKVQYDKIVELQQS